MSCFHVNILASMLYERHSPLELVPTLLVQEFELTIDLDVMLAELDKEQTGSIDYKEFKSLLD